MAKQPKLGFIRTPTGVKILAPRASFHMTFAEISGLANFIASGNVANTNGLRRKLAITSQQGETY
jgi:hypothetical protein